MSHTYCIVLCLFFPFRLSAACLPFVVKPCCAYLVGHTSILHGCKLCLWQSNFFPFSLSALEVMSDMGPNSLGRMSISSPVFFPWDSSRVTRRAPRCEWVWKSWFQLLNLLCRRQVSHWEYALELLLASVQAAAYMWTVTFLLDPKGAHARAIGDGISCTTARQGGWRTEEKQCLLSLYRFSIPFFSPDNLDCKNFLLAQCHK